MAEINNFTTLYRLVLAEWWWTDVGNQFVDASAFFRVPASAQIQQTSAYWLAISSVFLHTYYSHLQTRLLVVFRHLRPNRIPAPSCPTSTASSRSVRRTSCRGVRRTGETRPPQVPLRSRVAADSSASPTAPQTATRRAHSTFPRVCSDLSKLNSQSTAVDRTKRLIAGEMPKRRRNNWRSSS